MTFPVTSWTFRTWRVFVPWAPHMPVPLLLFGLVAFTSFFLFSGARAFARRTIL